MKKYNQGSVAVIILVAVLVLVIGIGATYIYMQPETLDTEKQSDLQNRYSNNPSVENNVLNTKPSEPTPKVIAPAGTNNLMENGKAVEMVRSDVSKFGFSLLAPKGWFAGDELNVFTVAQNKNSDLNVFPDMFEISIFGGASGGPSAPFKVCAENENVMIGSDTVRISQYCNNTKRQFVASYETRTNELFILGVSDRADNDHSRNLRLFKEIVSSIKVQ